MGAMQNLGGRKFLMTLVVLGVAIFLELHSDKGLTTTMAGFMVAIIGTFHASNFACSNVYAKAGKGGSVNIGPVHEKLDGLASQVQAGFAPERTQALQQLLVDIKNGIQQNQVLTGQVAQTLLMLGKNRG